MSTRAIRRDGRLYYTDSTRGEAIWPANPEVWLFDDFIDKAVDATSQWNSAGETGGTTGTFAYNAQAGGVARITTGGADNDEWAVASGLGFRASLGACVEVRLAAGDVTKAGFCVGFSDAVSETGNIALSFGGAAGALDSAATDAVAFVLDSDKSSTHVWACAVKNNTDGTPVDTAVVPTTGAFKTYRIETNAAGDARFYIDGTLVSTQAAAITASTALCVYIGVINREAAANTWDIDYIKAWQNRS